MNEDANIRVVRQLYDAFGQGDIDTILQAVAADVEWHQLVSLEGSTSGAARVPGRTAPGVGPSPTDQPHLEIV